ncbi:MAG: hypothetical protein H6R00_2183 [Proteobacteria bacterium]|nr:hypothetical protein [Pseudomonadota bacterium]
MGRMGVAGKDRADRRGLGGIQAPAPALCVPNCGINSPSECHGASFRPIPHHVRKPAKHDFIDSLRAE